jgi:hypothetical protein
MSPSSRTADAAMRVRSAARVRPGHPERHAGLRPPAPRPDAAVACPQCGRAAQIVDRFTLAGWPEPAEHVKIICTSGHWFTPMVDGLDLV